MSTILICPENCPCRSNLKFNRKNETAISFGRLPNYISQHRQLQNLKVWITFEPCVKTQSCHNNYGLNT